MTLLRPQEPPSPPFCLRNSFTVQARNFTLSLGQKTKIMGILNITPDSFSQDGLLAANKRDPDAQFRYGLKLIRQGADILDIGGESARPGAKTVTAQEEIRRVVPVIRLLARKIKIPISIDTSKPDVAVRALDAGASIVNIVRGTKITKLMLEIIKKHNAAVVLMHMRKTPATMQKKVHYHDLIKEITNELQTSIEKCLETGIKSDKIIIDPGIGFCKTTGHSFEIIRRLNAFSTLKKPILIGPSRKSFIGNIINQGPLKRHWGTASAVCASILNGAHIIRVHDVDKMRDVADIADAVLAGSNERI